MSAFKPTPVAGGAPKKDILAPLHSVKMASTASSTKPVLPAEIISTILDYLPISDLLHFARASRRMQEMVYDDTRWVQRLRLMGCWNEAEARKRFEEGMRRKFEAQRSKGGPGKDAAGMDGNAESRSEEPPTITLFDASLEEERRKQVGDQAAKVRPDSLTDGFEALSLSKDHLSPSAAEDPTRSLRILRSIRSIRGNARREYGRVYGALAPLYFDLARCKTHTDAELFRNYRDPEHQAVMLAQLQRFARSDLAQGCLQREERLASMMGVFETAVLREFEKGVHAGDVDGRMRQYAHVLVALNGGQAGVDLFIQTNPLFQDKDRLENPMACINQASSNSISLSPSHDFFDRLSSEVKTQVDVIHRVFPPPLKVIGPLLERVGRDILSGYITPLFDECHTRSLESYLKAVAGIFEQSLRFAGSLQALPNTDADQLESDLDRVLAQVFEPHVDLYLAEELEFFKQKADAEVSRWESQLSEQDASTEAFFMANVNRQADKRDFLSSFKKVVMMPVNALPMSSPFGSSKTTTTSSNGTHLDPNLPGSQSSTRPSSPGLTASPLDGHSHSHGLRPPTPSLNRALTSTPPPSAPTTELAAKAALMNSRLEGIRSLFSIEVALNLVHLAKASLERAALFVHLGSSTPSPVRTSPHALSPSGEAAKLQCLTTFVLLLHSLGARHIKPGFDTAVGHLSSYNPRASTTPHSQPSGVAPLVTFLELVNVGDLIQQMVDVFYEQELVATKLADRNDFLDPSVKEKRRFEQMLDERVAAGLNRGIDVLMAEVEYLLATTQPPTDYNPGAVGAPSLGPSPSPASMAASASAAVPDLAGPTPTASLIVGLVSSHTRMLVGSTDKNTLDVFNQEVGLRLFSTLCKHLKRQRISVDGAMTLLSDMQAYSAYVATLRNADLLAYFKALREVSQLYLIDKRHAKDMTAIIADSERFYGVFGAEEVYEFAERRADWAEVRAVVERGLYGIGCVVM